MGAIHPRQAMAYGKKVRGRVCCLIPLELFFLYNESFPVTKHILTEHFPSEGIFFIAAEFTVGYELALIYSLVTCVLLVPSSNH